MDEQLLSAPGAAKYSQMHEHMRRQIEQGELRPGDRVPSLREMQDLYGASRATVHKVQVMLEQDGLIVREQGRGAFVTERPTRRQTGIIGFCGFGFTATHSSPYWTELVAGVRAALAQHEKRILLLENDSSFGWDKVDGVLMSYHSGGALRWLPEDVPCVYLLKSVPTAGDAQTQERLRSALDVDLSPAEQDQLLAPQRLLSSVVADDYSGARAATEYLLSLGHRRIAFLSNKTEISGQRRLAGYQDALRAASSSIDRRYVRSLATIPEMNFLQAGREKMTQWLKEDWNTLGCTALLAYNDETALGAMEVLRKNNVAMPGQVSVIGFDGLDISEHSRPSLTTVKVPLHKIGKAGGEMLLQLVANEATETRHATVPTKLAIRASTAAPRSL